MHLANYLGYLHKAELNLAEGFRKVADGHAEEADVYHTCYTLAQSSASATRTSSSRLRTATAKRSPMSPSACTTSSSTRPVRVASASCAIYMICT